MSPVSRETSREHADGGDPPAVPAAPPSAAAVFGERLPAARQYARLLATDGVTRGLLGPREVSRLWERHLLNCAVVAELLPAEADVIDVGSGAGLPGIPLALARPDLRIELLEPLERRAVFLRAVLAELDLDRVTVRRGRAEEVGAGSGADGAAGVDVVTARAVAPLSRLVGWCLPLLRAGGSLVALKGQQASIELAAAEDDLRRLGAVEWGVESCGHGLVDPPTTVVRVVVGVARAGRPGTKRPGSREGKGRR